MRYKIAIGADDFIQVLENIDKVSDILNIQVDPYGIMITVKKGLIKPIEEKYWLSYSIVRSVNKYVVVFHLSGSLSSVAKVEVEGKDEGSEIRLECIDKNLCKYVNVLVKKLVENFEKAIEKVKKTNRTPEYRAKFSLSTKYGKVIDGLAEVTLSSLYLRYPLLDRKTLPLNDVKDLNNFLTELYLAYNQKANEIFVHVAASKWMFILAVDLLSKEYTPSFIDLESNVRLVGKEAIEALKQRNDPFVSITILSSNTKLN